MILGTGRIHRVHYDRSWVPWCQRLLPEINTNRTWLCVSLTWGWNCYLIMYLCVQFYCVLWICEYVNMWIQTCNLPYLLDMKRTVLFYCPSSKLVLEITFASADFHSLVNSSAKKKNGALFRVWLWIEIWLTSYHVISRWKQKEQLRDISVPYIQKSLGSNTVKQQA